jgi:hypothetical protein
VEKLEQECQENDGYIENAIEHFITDLKSSNEDDDERDSEDSDSA